MSIQWARHIPTMATRNAYGSLAQKYLETLEQVTYCGWSMFVKPRSSQCSLHTDKKCTLHLSVGTFRKHPLRWLEQSWESNTAEPRRSPLSCKPNHGTLCWGPSTSHPDIPLPCIYFNITPHIPLSLKWPLMWNFLIKISVSTYIFHGTLTSTSHIWSPCSGDQICEGEVSTLEYKSSAIFLFMICTSTKRLSVQLHISFSDFTHLFS